MCCWEDLNRKRFDQLQTASRRKGTPLVSNHTKLTPIKFPSRLPDSILLATSLINLQRYWMEISWIKSAVLC